MTTTMAFRFRTRLGTLALVLAAATASGLAAAAEPVRILFVGNSFTYTRPPALQYNIENVTDLNEQNAIDKPEGSNPALPQPWGGVAGIFKALTDQAGLDYEVSHSLRGGATLRGHVLNTNPAGWDLRANIMSASWDVVVLQGNSTEAIGRAGGFFAQFDFYVRTLQRIIRVGDAHSFRETQAYGGTSNATRSIPANPNANPLTAIYLYQTWARPDLTYPEGVPYAGEPLETMTEDVRAAYAQTAVSNGGIDGIVPVGEAFMRAVQDGVATRNPYEPEPRKLDLWWEEDQFHSSVYGSYLSALVMFGSLTGVDPASFGANERAASDLGIAPHDALALQKVASAQLAVSGYGAELRACLRSNPASRAVAVCQAQ
jgi:hypothetical protein